MGDEDNLPVQCHPSNELKKRKKSKLDSIETPSNKMR